MKSYIKIIATMKELVAFTLLVAAMASCSDDGELMTPKVSGIAETAQANTVTNAEVANFTISGLYTEVVTDIKCSTCTFVVAAGTKQVDGQALGLKPGAVICLQTGIQYPSIEFVNMVGSANSPITIGYCKE